MDRLSITQSAMGPVGAAVFGQGWRPWAERGEQPAISGGGLVDCSDGAPLARSSKQFRQLEYGVQALPGLGES